MRFMDSKKVTSFLISIPLIFSLCSVSFFASFVRAWAIQSDEEMTAKLVEGAKKERELLWYHPMNAEEGNKLLQPFHEKYPFIKVGMYRGDSAILLSKITAEDQSKKYYCDVVSVPAITIEVLKRRNLLAKYTSPHEKFFSDVFKDPQGYWVGSYYMLNVVAYNTRFVSSKEVPRTYEDLLNSKWKGKIGMEPTAFFWFYQVLKVMGEEKGLKYMQNLSEQNIQFRSGKPLNSLMVAAGETAITLPAYNNRIDMMKADGAPIEWTTIEPLIVEINPPGVSAHAPHPHAARLFVNFLLSKEGQEIIASFYRLPTRNDVDARSPKAKAKGQKMVPFDPAFIDNYDKYVKLYREILMKRPTR